MQKYSQETVLEVLAANDIVDVVGAVLDLKPAGTSRFKTLCPFHQEKTPSFSVDRERQMFYCFGCQKHGDAISFVREYEGLSFIEALRQLGDRGGVRLPALTERDNKDEFQRTELFKLGAFAARFFRDTLQDPLKGGKGRAYLKTRALSEETCKQFGIGYAQDDWTALADAARADGFHDAALLASGLAKSRESGGCYDFFRNRLMFPIREPSGKVVAFGGRDLGGESQAKYINSLENTIYKKGRMLYGLHECRDALRHEKCALIVEGYFDLLRCYDAGIRNVVAICGTALTGDQAHLLHRYVSEVVVVYDGDAAGVRAALRGVAVLTAEGLSVRALALPEGQDPDDFVQAEGADALRDRVERAPDFVSFYVRMNEDRLRSIEGRTDVARELFAILMGIDDLLRREQYLKRIAHELQLGEWEVRAEFTKSLRDGRSRRPRPAPAEDPDPVHKPHPDDTEFVAVLLSNRPLRATVEEALRAVSLQPGPVTEVLQSLLHTGEAGMAASLETDAARALYAAAANWEVGLSPRSEDLVQKRVTRLKREALESEAVLVQQAIRQAERAGDTAQIPELLAKKMSIEREIQELDGA